MSKAISLYIYAILFVLLAAWCISSKPGVSYEKTRADFKHNLFERQQNIITEDRYMIFIERYIKEAEAKLQIPQYLMNNPNTSWCGNYFNCLLHYNVAYFNAYAKTYSAAGKDVEQCEIEIARTIELIKAEGNLTDLDTKQEFEKTKELYARANRRFYKKLGIGVRIFNFFRTIGQ